MNSTLTITLVRGAPPCRRQLLRLVLGASLVVPGAVPAIAAPAWAVQTAAREEVKTEETGSCLKLRI
jgi:hypothetical protein